MTTTRAEQARGQLTRSTVRNAQEPVRGRQLVELEFSIEGHVEPMPATASAYARTAASLDGEW